MTIPKLTISERGILAPDEQDILRGALDSISSAFGGNLNTSTLETPQGQLATILTAAAHDKNNSIINVANQFDPMTATGIYLDALGKIYGAERKKEIPASCTLVFHGADGTVIPEKSEFKSQGGDVWKVLWSSTIKNGRTYIRAESSGDASLLKQGDPLTQSNVVFGISKVFASTDFSQGSPLETDAQFRKRISLSTQSYSRATTHSVLSALLQLEGVVDAYVVDNPTSQPKEVNGVTIRPHAIYCCVSGGDDYKVARKIWELSGSGCDYEGNTQREIADWRYQEPRPSYTIRFSRPKNVQIGFAVLLKQQGALQNYKELIKSSIKQTLSNLGGARIGQQLYVDDFICAMNKIQNMRLINAKIIKDGGPASDFISMNIDELPVLADYLLSISIQYD